jgi:hydroxyacylglutathione hydrolase
MNTQLPQVTAIPQLQDNYCYLVESQNQALVIDPAEAEPIINTLAKKNLKLVAILNTHHHSDHTSGNLELKQKFGAAVYANGHDKDKIPGFDFSILEKSKFNFLNQNIEVIESPGHTQNHLMYYFKNSGDLFTGDTLFLLGCGRIFDSNPIDFFRTLEKIKSLPDSTKIWCGHEYTIKNAEFSTGLLGEKDLCLTGLIARYKNLRALKLPTVPGILSEERVANLFFRCNESALKSALKLPSDCEALTVFKELRSLKNDYS